MTRAGEMICAYLDLDPDQFMYFREGSASLLEQMDPVQFLIPTPETSKPVPEVDKLKACVILNDIFYAAQKTLKEFSEHLTISKQELQPLYHYLIEDILWAEFRYDFEDFKQTLMDFHILNDQSIVEQLFEFNQDLEYFFDDKFDDE